MSKRMIVTLPDHDITIHYLNVWSRRSAESASEYSITVTMLDGEKANRKSFESYLSKLHFDLIFLNGHGTSASVTGHNNEPLIVAGENEERLKSTITYAISCSSADRLGDASIKAGAFAYVGYTKDFIFTLDESGSTHPLEDKVAGIFLNHTSVLMHALYKGNTVSEAYEKAKSALVDSITLVESSGNRSILSWLLWDYEAFAFKGNGDSRIS